ncbi:hypothetical protein VQL36_04000 [Chengkuizengella sp. SCS-71B]|uniref:hypothetical protein n=1 Tax=Chengkuizengella sp. SCS-71B TaxID=3115290 RepID=UPI0032C21E0F
MFKSYLKLFTLYLLSILLLSPFYFFLFFESFKVGMTDGMENYYIPYLSIIFTGFFAITAIPLLISLKKLSEIRNKEKYIVYVVAALGMCLISFVIFNIPD